MHLTKLTLLLSFYNLVAGASRWSRNTRPWYGPTSESPSVDSSFYKTGPAFPVGLYQIYFPPNESYTNSHWAACWITTTSGLDILLLSFWNSKGGQGGLYAGSYYDINSGIYLAYGSPYTLQTQNDTVLDVHFNDTRYRWYANTKDNFSSITTWMDAGGLQFNITFEPRGPNLYHGGSGVYWWNEGLSFEWAAPGALTTGSITVNDTTHQIDPALSTTWYDRQFGGGIPSAGWFWFPLSLSNGLRLAVWRTNPDVITGDQRCFATALYPDGHQEVFAIDPDLQESGSWVSAASNTTYYSSFQITVLDNNSVLNVLLPNASERQYGEIPGGRAAFEGYATVSGVWKGQEVKGFGLSEQLHTNL